MTMKNAIGEQPLTPRRLGRFARRQIVQRTLAARYWGRNRVVRTAVNDPECGAIVSLTTHGVRLRSVYLALESIAAGKLRPQKLLLWVDSDQMAEAQRLPTLRRLIARGLEVRPADGSLRPHKKYFHYVNDDLAEQFPFVTADDDIFYASQWLESLWAQFRAANGRLIVSSWVKRIGLSEEGFDPYDSWKTVDSSETNELNYFMSGSGTIFPIAFSLVLRRAGRAFMDCTPLADDIWLNMQAKRSNQQIRQAGTRAPDIWSIPGSQRIKLSSINVSQSLNDRQLAATFSMPEIRRLQGFQQDNHDGPVGT